MKFALTQLIIATVTTVLFLLLNRAGEKKISAFGRYLTGLILAVSFLVPMRIPLIRIEIPETKIENTGLRRSPQSKMPFSFPRNSLRKIIPLLLPPLRRERRQALTAFRLRRQMRKNIHFFLHPNRLQVCCGFAVRLSFFSARFTVTAERQKRCAGADAHLRSGNGSCFFPFAKRSA